MATAFAFLCDRPAASLVLIKSMELDIAEGYNMTGTQHAHYPVVRRTTDSEMLRYAYNYYPDLCTLLSTPRVNLQKLYSAVETLTGRKGGTALNDDSLERGIVYEERTFKSARFEPPPWLAPLLQIHGRQSVDLCWWMYAILRIQRMACMAGLIRQHMLANGGTRTAPPETSQNEH